MDEHGNLTMGYPGHEFSHLAAMLEVPGKEKQKISFEKFLGYIFQDADAEFFASHGLDCIRLPFTYRHFENDMSPRELKILAFKHLDQFINFLCYVNNHEMPDHQLTIYVSALSTENT
ncbi:hypothetical protein PZA11_005263 [Diplocarpon coronariae]